MIFDNQALVRVEIQFDFLEGGALAVPFASEVLSPVINLAGSFKTRVVSQDWHPKMHKSFASTHPGKKAYDTLSLNGKAQVLWPDHCVQNSVGARVHPEVLGLDPDIIIQKGTDVEIDSYSVFFDNHHAKKTYLDEWLKSKEISHLVFAGLATDYCVLFSVLDALALGYSVSVFPEGCRGVNLNIDDSERAFKEMSLAGATFLEV